MIVPSCCVGKKGWKWNYGCSSFVLYVEYLTGMESLCFKGEEDSLFNHNRTSILVRKESIEIFFQSTFNLSVVW